MATETQGADARSGAEPSWRGDIARALAAAAAVGLVAAAGGFRGLDAGADNDSLLRLVMVRDLLAGQGWFDLHQYRMGVDGAPPMHWSRLVDAPIAAIVLLVSAATGSQIVGETAALVLWPLMLYAAALYLLIRIARLAVDETVVFPITVIGATTLYYVGIFEPGAIDHHNVQLVLMLAMVFFLLRAEEGNRSAVLAGIAAVLMLAVGMETAPYVAAGSLFVAGWFLLKGGEARDPAAQFGIAFAITAAAVFVATVPSADWGTVQCDAYSSVHFVVGAMAGAGLAIVVSLPAASSTYIRRAAALAALGFGIGLVTATHFPQCLGDPYANLPPMLQSYWLEAVSEAQPVWRLLGDDPAKAAGHYATVVVALLGLTMHAARRGLRRADVLLLLMLSVALLVSVWQVRGSRFSLPLASVALAMWVAGFRGRAKASPGLKSSLALVAAWLACFQATWIIAAHGFSVFGERPAEAGKGRSPCNLQSDFARLADMPATGVLAISNLGAPILRHTHHHVLAGPYHRNVEGNLAALDTFMGPPQDGARIVGDNGIGLVAVCPGNSESAFLAKRAPDGLLAALLAGKPPAWMEIVPESTGEPLQLFRVIPD